MSVFRLPLRGLNSRSAFSSCSPIPLSGLAAHAGGQGLLGVTGLTTALLGILSDPAVPQRSSNPSAVVEPAPIRAARAPRPGEYGAAFDAQHYDISLTLPPSGSVISGHTEVTVARRPGRTLDAATRSDRSRGHRRQYQRQSCRLLPRLGQAPHCAAAESAVGLTPANRRRLPRHAG